MQKGKLPALALQHPRTVALLAGALLALTMPRGFFFPLLFLCVPLLVLLTQKAESKKQSFLLGWLFGAGYFIISLYWVSVALTVDLESFWWVLPFSSLLGPGLLGMVYGFVPLLAWRYRHSLSAYTLAFVAAFGLIEWLRGHMLTGFPWNLPGYAWHVSDAMLQSTAVVGIYGLTLLTLLWSCFPLIKNKKAQVCLVASLLAVWLGGWSRLETTPTTFYPDQPMVRIVQPNIPQSMKWEAEERLENLRTHLRLTTQPSDTPLRAVIWPETAAIHNPERDQEVVSLVAAHLPRGSIGILGMLKVEYTLDSTRFFNAIAMIDPQGKMVAQYNKHHLVPFGEYIPFREYLNLTPIAAGIAMIGDFTPGDGPQTVHLPGLPSVSPQVCYEGIFPRQAALHGEQRPAWMVNVTNDAWYGHSAGPYQHLEITRVRAIEEGLPLARAANTGISAMIDPLGRVIAHTALGERTVLDAPLPQPLAPTPYTRFGDSLFFGMLLLLLVGGEWLRRKKA